LTKSLRIENKLTNNFIYVNSATLMTHF